MKVVRIRIILVDDHAVLRSGLKMLLNSQNDMIVVGEAATGEEALALSHEIEADVLVLDLTLPGMSGLEVLARLQRETPGVRVLVLTMHDDEGYLRGVLKEGASGYILKKAADVELLSAIRAVHQGEVFLDHSMARVLVKDLYGESNKVKPNANLPLSERENEILRCVAMGFTNMQIANQLAISVKTVESHKAHIREKLNLYNRSDLVRYAIQHGLLPRS
ncbi:MAG: response regulator transcription factor [Bacillota bacterium]